MKSTATITAWLWAGCFLLLSLVSCRKDDTAGFTYPVLRQDFEDNLIIEGVVQAIRQQAVTCPPEVEWSVIRYLMDDGSLVKKGDTLCLLEDGNMQVEYERAMENLYTARVNYENTLLNLEMQYAKLEADALSNAIDQALSALDTLQVAYYTPAQRRLADLNARQNRIQQEKLDRNLATMKVVNDTELMKLRLQVQHEEDNVAAFEARFADMVIVSPGDGLFIVSENIDKGRKFDEGDNLFGTLGTLPYIDSLQVRFDVTEQEFKRMGIGQPIRFRFNGLPGAEGFGHVNFKASVAQNRNGRKTFRVTAILDDFPQGLLPDMTANALVNIATVPDTLCVPIVSVFDKDSCKVVYLCRDKGYVEQEVGLGPQSSSHVVVSAGLREGDRLSMIRPRESRILEHIEL